MGKYSSDSNSSDYHSSKKRSGRIRHRHSSSDSSSSSYRRHRKKTTKYKSKSRRRSRSRDRYHKPSPTPSSSKSRTTEHRRSRDRRSKSKTRKDRRTRSKSRERRRSLSKNKKHKSRSSSAERHRKHRKSTSPSRGKKPAKFVDLTSDNEDAAGRKFTNADPEYEAKLRKYYNANTTEFKDMSSNEDSNDLNDPDKFLQFSSKAKKVPDNIVIDLKSQTILVPEVTVDEEKLTIFHPNLMPNEEIRIEKWVKDLYTFRQKALKGELSIN